MPTQLQVFRSLNSSVQEILAEFTYKQNHRRNYKRWDADAFTLIQQATPTISTVKLGEEKRRYWAEAQSKDLHISLIYDRPAQSTEKNNRGSKWKDAGWIAAHYGAIDSIYP